MKRNFLKITLALVIAFATFSCDKDFNSVGSDIIGEDHFNFEKYEVQNLVAYSKATGAVQSNNLPVNAFGIYDNPAFGTTTASFVTQLELTRTYDRPEKIIGENITFKPTDSVYLYVPYFSKDTKVVDENTNFRIFKLDSIYGDKNTTFDLKIYENGYFLNNFSAADDFLNSQKHYSDEANKFDVNIVGSQLNTSSNILQNTNFKFNSDEIVLYKSKLLDDGTYVFVDKDGVTLTSQGDVSARVIKDRMTPGMWINLDKNIIKNRILDAALNGNLYNNNVFKEYFKGLYFKTQQTSAGSGAMAMLDFSKGYVIVQYHSDLSSTDASGNVVINNNKRVLKMNFGGNTVNLINHAKSAAYQNALTTSNTSAGDEKLYVKGSDGSTAFIDLFGPVAPGETIPTELQILRNNNWLINDAFLIFYVDKASMSNPLIAEPNRILLFDATNNRPLVDYTVDRTVAANLKYSKYNLGGIVELEDVDNGRAVKYKIRITNQIRNILNNTDETLNKNIRLGLSITENINLSSNAFLKTPIIINTEEIKFTPIGNVLSPLGTILYGSNVAPINEDKKLKLQIFYTKPN